MKKFRDIELTDWVRSAGGWFKYNIDYTNNPMFSACLYHDKNEEFSSPYHISGHEKQPRFSSIENHMWTPVFCHSVNDLNPIFRKIYGKEFSAHQTEAKNLIDEFLEKMNGLTVFI